MRFGMIGMTRPENFPHLFNIYKQESFTAATGRERLSTPEKIGQKRLTLSLASPDEAERFKQWEMTVTHTIFHPGPPVAKKNYVFALLDKDGEKELRYFRVKAVQDRGEMHIKTTYFCEERSDINGIGQN